MTKRWIALLQVMACLLLLCAPVSAAASSSAYNAGTRHVTCDALSDAAASYYEAQSYETLSAQSSSQLLTSLRQLMTSTHSYKSVYSDCRDMAAQTDSMGNDGKISLLYTSVTVTRANFGGNTGTWNREHVWPKSLGGFDNSGAGADLHHIRPSDATINSRRGNLKFGNASSGKDAQGSTLVSGMSGGKYTSTYFEPLDNVKGDVARICLYVYARYGGELSKCGDITNVFQSVDVLLEWCAQDPVDAWEMGRNDTVEDIQGNRNVFIDYPEYAWLIFGKELPTDMSTPSGEAKKAGASAEQPDTPPVQGDTPTDQPSTPPAQDGACAHEFDAWEGVGNGEMMRFCSLCGKVEIAPQSGNESDGTPDSVQNDGVDDGTVMVVIIVCGVAVVGVGVGIITCRHLARSKKKPEEENGQDE